jgi:hypothetical protein
MNTSISSLKNTKQSFFYIRDKSQQKKINFLEYRDAYIASHGPILESGETAIDLLHNNRP